MCDVSRNNRSSFYRCTNCFIIIWFIYLFIWSKCFSFDSQSTLYNFYRNIYPIGKKGLKIDYNQIDSLYISQGVFTLDIEIVVSNQNKIYGQVSFSNEIMLGSSDRFQIKYKLIPKSERPKLFKALDYIMDWKEDETSN